MIAQKELLGLPLAYCDFCECLRPFSHDKVVCQFCKRKKTPQRLECDGYGPKPADYMFVGISAGRHGALITRTPLTKDASGRVFQRCLNALGFSNSDEFSTHPELRDCYITNLVKSRVLEKDGTNRLPTTKEKYLWFPYFQHEVSEVQPKYIIALGSIVFDFLRVRQSELRAPIRFVKHPRWYQAHGALKHGSSAFHNMVKDYRYAINRGVVK